MWNAVMLWAGLAIFATFCGDALAQRPSGPGGGDDRRMSHQERERMREEMNRTRRDVYHGGHERQMPPGGNRMSDAEREKLRRDVDEANRGMRKR